MSAMVSSASSFTISVGRTTKEHRGVVATLQRLQGYCCWFCIEVLITEFVKQCLHCMGLKAGEKVPRTLGEMVHGTRTGEVLHFDYLCVGDSSPLGKDGLDEGDMFKYILVMMDDLSNFVWLEPTESCTAALTAKHLLRWGETLGLPDIWVSETASHFNNRVMEMLERALRVEHRLAVANSPWSYGTCERIMRKVVPAIQWTLNMAYRERYVSTPTSCTGRRH